MPHPLAFKSPVPTAATGSTLPTPGAPIKPTPPAGARFTRLSPEEMAQCRLDGLCFNYPKKFSREHAKQCSMKGIYFMDLESVDDTSDGASEDEPSISINTITGIQSSSTLQLATVVHAIGLIALVHSGSSHSFIAENTAARTGLTSEPCPGLTVNVANSDHAPSSSICKDVVVHIGQEEFCINLFVIPLDDYELVLGCEWLCTLRRILWDFNRLSMAFWHQDHRVKWVGVNAWPSPHLALTDATDLLALLLQEFANLFATPSGLPPPRVFDHRIHLLPATPPVAVRP